jgi:hypothetical protein
LKKTAGVDHHGPGLLNVIYDLVTVTVEDPQHVLTVHPVFGASEADKKKGLGLGHEKISGPTVDPGSNSSYGWISLIVFCVVGANNYSHLP